MKHADQQILSAPILSEFLVRNYLDIRQAALARALKENLARAKAHAT